MAVTIAHHDMKPKAFFLLFTVVSLLLSNGTLGQEKMAEEMLPDIEWGEGSIMLNDGTAIEGLIRYNDKNGLVSYEQGSDSRSFTARSILGFEFFDYRVNRQRIFYTIEYEDAQGQGLRPLFFEVLKEFKTFAVLTKMDRVEIEMKKDPGGTFYNGTIAVTVNNDPKTIITQTETVYIMNPAGEIKPYLRLTRKIVDRKLYDRSRIKRKILDNDLLKEYFVEPGYSKMIRYAEENDLDFEVKEDLLRLLEYYQEVME